MPRFHISRVSKQFLKRHDGVEFEPLAPYSPHGHPIERFWQWLKAKANGASACATIEAVIEKVRQLVWHDNEGWLTTPIHFDFAPYAQIL